MILLWFLLGFLGMGGVLIFGIMLVFEGLSAAQFKAESGVVPGLVKRSAKGTLKLFLISLAIMVVGLLLSGLSP